MKLVTYGKIKDIMGHSLGVTKTIKIHPNLVKNKKHNKNTYGLPIMLRGFPAGERVKIIVETVSKTEYVNKVYKEPQEEKP